MQGQTRPTEKTIIDYDFYRECARLERRRIRRAVFRALIRLFRKRNVPRG
jgi:hypothetical protein